jgi:outer membrane lipoprotein LolB
MRASFLLACLFAICSCSTSMLSLKLTSEEASNLSEERTETIARFSRWSFASRFFLKSDEGTFSGGLKWNQHDDVFTLEFSGPFGIESVVIKGNANVVKLMTSDGQSVLAKSPEALMASQFGWKVPISHFRYWLLGIPDPRLLGAVSNSSFDPAGRWLKFSQAECKIDIAGYYENREPNLPRRVSVVCGERHSRVAFRDWEISE